VGANEGNLGRNVIADTGNLGQEEESGNTGETTEASEDGSTRDGEVSMFMWKQFVANPSPEKFKGPELRESILAGQGLVAEASNIRLVLKLESLPSDGSREVTGASGTTNRQQFGSVSRLIRAIDSPKLFGHPIDFGYVEDRVVASSGFD
jgi:hypothetical protein